MKISEIKDFCEYKVDNLGNIICFKKGKKSAVKKVMADAHMDEVGFMVRKTDDLGCIYFHTIGSISKGALCARRVTLKGNDGIKYKGVIDSKAIHSQTAKERKEYIELLKILDLGLEKRLTAKVGLLSGGQRQALTLLMATLKQPKVLLLDEHTAALDPKTAKKVLDITESIVEKNNLTTIMITHNMADAIRVGNRLIMMHEGQIVVDVKGEEKKNLTIEQLLQLFEASSGSQFTSDKVMLSK